MAQGALARNITIYTKYVLVVSLHCTAEAQGRKIFKLLEGRFNHLSLKDRAYGRIVTKIVRVISLKAQAGLSSLLL